MWSENNFPPRTGFLPPLSLHVCLSVRQDRGGRHWYGGWLHTSKDVLCACSSLTAFFRISTWLLSCRGNNGQSTHIILAHYPNIRPDRFHCTFKRNVVVLTKKPLTATPICKQIYFINTNGNIQTRGLCQSAVLR